MVRTTLRSVITLFLLTCVASSALPASSVRHANSDVATEKHKEKIDFAFSAKLDISHGAGPLPGGETEEEQGTPEPSVEAIEFDVDVTPPYEALVMPASGKADSAVFVLHGLGGNAKQAMDLMGPVYMIGFDNTKFIFPNAPMQFNTFANKTTRSWFDIISSEVGGPEDVEGVIEAAENINKMAMFEEKAFGIRRDRMAIIGISQGGALTMTTYLRHKWAGALSALGYLPISNTYPADLTDDSADAPLIMMNDEVDELIPIAAARLGETVIRSFGRNVTYVPLEGDGHNFDQSFQTLVSTTRLFLQNVLG